MLKRWKRRARIDHLLYGTEPLAALRRPYLTLILAATLAIGAWGGFDYGRKVQWHQDFVACVDGSVLVAR